MTSPLISRRRRVSRREGAGLSRGMTFARSRKGGKDMTSDVWHTQEVATAPAVTAPDGAEVRVLCATERGSMIRFTLQPGAISKAVAHRTVEEIWYVVSGAGRLWRKLGDQEEITDLAPGLSLTIPPGTQ